MNCLILGGTGYLGEKLATCLIRVGHTVTIYGRNELRLRRMKKSNPSYSVIKGDIINDSIENILAGKDCVFYLISATNASNLDLIKDLNLNVNPAVKVIEYCAKHGIRIIFFSSGGTVYGNVREVDIPIKEVCDTNPISAYGVSKLTIEKIIKYYASKYDFMYTILRISNPYGPGQLTNKGQGAIAVFLKRIFEKQKIEIWGDGSTVRDYIYIDDLMDACIKIVDMNIQGTLNIGSGYGSSLNQILAIIKNVLGEEITVNYIKKRSQDVEINVLDISKLREAISWNPKVSLEEGIKRMIDEYR